MNKIIVGLSGGRDSIALAHFLNKEFEVIAVHVNHGLRDDASKDTKLVKEFCNKNKIKLEVYFPDVKKLMSEGQGLELAARNARHQCFIDAAKKYDCRTVALGHHKNDDAETIIHNTARGCFGIKGISKTSEFVIQNEKLTITRPILEWTREKVTQYCVSFNLNWAEDPSNQDTDLTLRNKLRQDIIPEINKATKRDFVSGITQAKQDWDEAQTALNMVVDSINYLDPTGKLFLPTIKTQPKAIQKIIIARFFTEQNCKFNREMVESTINTIMDPNTKSVVNLRENKQFKRKQGRGKIEQIK